MTKLSDILEHLESYLDVSSFNDPSLNGLQVEGRSAVERIALGVSASMELFGQAIAWKADAVLVHHGLLWGVPLRVVGPFARRIKALLTADISLLAYHLPIDAHPDDGNNAVLARHFDLKEVHPWGSYRGKPIGVVGETSAPIKSEDFVNRVAETCSSNPLVLGAEELKSIQTVCICSGGGGSLVEQAIEAGADVLVTGEPGEPALHLAREAGMLVIGAGHYNTERFGVQAVGERLEDEFDITTKFFEIPNPV